MQYIKYLKIHLIQARTDIKGYSKVIMAEISRKSFNNYAGTIILPHNFRFQQAHRLTVTKNCSLGKAQKKNQLLILLFTILQKIRYVLYFRCSGAVFWTCVNTNCSKSCSDRYRQSLHSIATQDVVIIIIALIVRKKHILY